MTTPRFWRFWSIAALLLLAWPVGLITLRAQNPPMPPPVPIVQGVANTVTIEAKGGSSTATVQWSQLYGPALAGISNPTARVTNVTMTQPGTYALQVHVTDGPNATDAFYYLTTSTSYMTPPQPGPLVVTVDVVPPTPSSDRTAPVISAVTKSSSNTDVLTGTATLSSSTSNYFTVTASDSVGVTAAQLLVDNYRVDLITADPQMLPASFQVHWYAKAVSSGSHQFNIRVWDAAGNSAMKTWMMTR